MKKLISFGIGIALLASPLLVSAQTVSTSNSSIIAILEQLVATLTQELQQLLARRGTPTTPSTNIQGNFTASPSSGSAPLLVNFQMTGTDENFATIDFGDGNSFATVDGADIHTCSGAGQGTVCWHTYTTPGTYTAKVEDSSGNVLSTRTITVAGGNQIGLIASPVSGASPLRVSFSGWTSDNADSYSLDFGDGTGTGIDAYLTCSHDISTNCGISHTYSSLGTYTARIVSELPACNATGGQSCVIPSSATTVSSATITVGNSNSTQSSATTGTITSSAGSSIVVGQPTTITLNATPGLTDTLKNLYINESYNGSAQGQVIESSTGSPNDVYTFTPTQAGTYVFYGWATTANYPTWTLIPNASVTITVKSAGGATPLEPIGTVTSSAGTSIQVGQSTTITLHGVAGAGDTLQYLYINKSFNGAAQTNLIESSQGSSNELYDVYTFTPTQPGTYVFYGWAYTNAYPDWYLIPNASVTVTVTGSQSTTTSGGTSEPTGTITSSAGSSITVGQPTTITLNATPSAGDSLKNLYINESYNGSAQGNVIESTTGSPNDVYTFTPTQPGTYVFYGWADTSNYPNWYLMPAVSVTVAVTSANGTPPPPSGTITSSAGSSITVGQPTTIVLNATPGAGDSLQFLYINESYNGSAQTNVIESSKGGPADVYTFTPTQPGTYVFYGWAYTDNYPNWNLLPNANVTISVTGSSSNQSGGGN